MTKCPDPRIAKLRCAPTAVRTAASPGLYTDGGPWPRVTTQAVDLVIHGLAPYASLTTAGRATLRRALASQGCEHRVERRGGRSVLLLGPGYQPCPARPAIRLANPRTGETSLRFACCPGSYKWGPYGLATSLTLPWSRQCPEAPHNAT